MVFPSWVQTSRPSFTGAESSEQVPERGDTFAPVRAMKVHWSACATVLLRTARKRQPSCTELRAARRRAIPDTLPFRWYPECRLPREPAGGGGGPFPTLYLSGGTRSAVSTHPDLAGCEPAPAGKKGTPDENDPRCPRRGTSRRLDPSRPGGRRGAHERVEIRNPLSSRQRCRWPS